MAQLNVKLSERQIDGLRRCAHKRRTPASWLIRDYVDYLVSGGEPVTAPDDGPTGMELALLAQHGGSFDWLADEPDLYTDKDGEPV